jgi:hypothetical protein
MFAKKLFVAVVSSAFLFSSIPAEAAFGKSSGSTSSSSSRSSSRVTSSRSISSPTSASRSSSYTSSGGISGGQSLGMSRSAVANNVRSGNYAAPANGTTVAGSNPGGNTYNRAAPSPSYNNSNPGYNSGYNNGGYAQPQPSSGHSTGTVLGAAAVAGAAGYMLGNHNSQPSQPVIINNGTNGGGYNGGGVAPSYNNGDYNGGGVAPAAGYNNGNNAGYAAPVSSGFSFGGFIWSLIKLLIGLIVLYFIVRFIMSLFRQNQSATPTTNFGGSVFNSKTPEDEIRDIKEQFFTDFQKNNRPSGIDYIRSHSEPMFFDAVEQMVRESSDTRVVRVKQLEAELVDLTQEGTRYIASVRYKAHVVEGEPGQDGVDTPINELWNFVYSNGTWKLAGIDQL